MSSKIWLLVALGIAVVYGYFAPGPLQMHGVVVGMSESEVLNRLGKPATSDARTWMYYFGPLAAGAEFLEVDFGPDKRVKAVSGEQLTRGRRVVATVGDSERQVVRALGPLRRRAGNGDGIRCYFEHVEVRLVDDKLVSISLSEP